MTPFRNEKNSNWEGAYRVPAMVRWPGRIPAGQVLNGIVSHNDWFVTLLAAAGDTDVAERLKQGADLAGTTYKVHLDGHNQLDYLTGGPARAPAALLLRLRRRRPHRPAVRQLEVRLPGAAGARERCTSGPSPTPSSGSRRSSTCAPIRTSAPTSRRTPTTTGCSTTPGLSSPPRPTSPGCIQTLAEFPPRQEPAELQHRPGAGEAAGRRRRPLTPVTRCPGPPRARQPHAARRRGPTPGSTLPGGLFTMGSDDHYPEEAPTHRVRVGRVLHPRGAGDQRGSSPRSCGTPGT